MKVWFLAFLSVGAIAVAAVACYNPALQSPGLYCMPTADQPCPDGQVCSNNRCVDPRTVRDGGGGGFDLGNSRTDMRSNSPRDLSSTAMGGCTGIIACGESCTTSSCIDACISAAPQSSQDLYTTALGCGQQFCLDRDRCDIDSTGTRLVDPIGYPAGTCESCLNDALSGLFGTSCTSTTYCNPAMCQSAYQACLND
jgi:hypothetical protein